MLSEMILLRAALAKREPHPSLTRNQAGPRDFVRLPAAKEPDAAAKQK